MEYAPAVSVPDLRALESLRAQIEANVSDMLPNWKSSYLLADIQKIYESRDLDLMRVYHRFLPTRGSVDLRNTVNALRSVHGPEVADVITDEHLDAFSDIWKALARLYTIQGRQSDILEETVTPLAFEDMSSVALILHLIEDREIGGADEIRALIKEIRASAPAPALIEGVL
jgi:hypothetical protein